MLGIQLGWADLSKRLPYVGVFPEFFLPVASIWHLSLHDRRGGERSMPGRNFMQKTFRCRRRVISFLETEEGKQRASKSFRSRRPHLASGRRAIASWIAVWMPAARNQHYRKPIERGAALCGGARTGEWPTLPCVAELRSIPSG